MSTNENKQNEEINQKIQEDLYQAIVDINLEKVQKIFREFKDSQERQALPMLQDGRESNDRLRPPPLYYVITLLNTKNMDEGLRIFKFLLENSNKPLVDPKQLFDETDKMGRWLSATLRDERPYENLIRYIIEYPFQNPELRSKLLTTLFSSNRSVEYQKLIQGRDSALYFAMLKSDYDTAILLVKHGAKSFGGYGEVQTTEDLKILFGMKPDVKKMKDLISEFVKKLSLSEKEEILSILGFNESVCSTAFNNGHTQSFSDLLNLTSRWMSKAALPMDPNLCGYILNSFLEDNSKAEALKYVFELVPCLTDDKIEGKPLLHIAAKMHNLPVVELLLSLKMDVNAVDDFGATALDYGFEDPKIKAVLIKAGAVDVQRSVLHYPSGNSSIVEELGMEKKLQAQSLSQLRTTDLARLDRDEVLLNKVHRYRQISTVICDSDKEAKRIKDQHRANFYLTAGKICPRCTVHIFSNEIPFETNDRIEVLQDTIEELNDRTCNIINELIQDIGMNFVLKSIHKREIKHYQESHQFLVHQNWRGDCAEILLFGPKKSHLEGKISKTQEKLDKNTAEIIKFMDEELKPFIDQETKKGTCSTGVFFDDDSFVEYIGRMTKSGRYKNYIIEFTSYDLKSELFLNNKPSLAVAQKWQHKQKDIRPILLRNRLGFDLLHRSMQPKQLNSYLSKYPRVTFTIGKHTLSFIDLCKDPSKTDYQFIVNTIITKSERLRELEIGNPAFFQTTPIISACFIDSKGTRPFRGGHQHNILFPVYLALSVPFENIAYTANTDIGAPFGDIGDINTKLEYLNKVQAIREALDIRQALYQSACLEKDPDRITPECPRVIWPALEQDPAVKVPVATVNTFRKTHGQLPTFTLEGLSRATSLNPTQKNSYNEIIIQPCVEGSTIEGRLLLVERRYLEKFIKEDYEKLNKNDIKDAEESLAILAGLEERTNGRIKLAIIDTDLESYKEKQSPVEQLKALQREIQNLKQKLYALDAREKRAALIGKDIPKIWHEENQAAKLEMKRLVEKKLSLEDLYKNPPRVMQWLSQNKPSNERAGRTKREAEVEVTSSSDKSEQSSTKQAAPTTTTTTLSIATTTQSSATTVTQVPLQQTAAQYNPHKDF